MRGVVSEALVSRKLVASNRSSEGSETTKSGTDEQKLYKRLIIEAGKQAHHCNAQKVNMLELVDTAVIGGRKMLLPGDLLK